MDLRTPIGLLFTAVGLLIHFYGAHHVTAAFLPVGINIDKVWGLVLLIFGLVMLVLAWLGRSRKTPA